MPIGGGGRFYGSTHHRVLRALVEQHDDVVLTGRPAFFVVEGEAGVGKSRLLLELYRTLGGRQAEPRYWPEPDERWNGYPSDVRPATAAMPFFWWGIPCPPAGRARPFQVLGDEITQIDAHAELLIATCEADRVLRDEAGEHVRGFATGVLTDLVPGSATAIALGQSLLRVLRAEGRARTLEAQLREGELVDATDLERDDLVTRALDVLSQLGERVPIVIAVDDAQSADVSLARLLADVQRMPAPIQVVIASHPAPSGAHALDPLLNSIPDLCRHNVGNLAQDDAVEMVATSVPRAPRDVVLALARKSAGSPRSVETLLRLARVRDGTVEAELGDVESLPDDYARQLERLWSEALPDGVKELLSASAMLCSAEGELVADLITGSLSQVRPGAREADFADAIARFGWLVHHDAVVRFAQPQHQVVSKERSVLLLREREALVRVAGSALTELTRSGLIETMPLRARRVALETHVRLAQQGVSHDAMIDAAAAFQLSLLLEQFGDDSEALALRLQCVEWAVAAGVDGQALLNLRSALVPLLLRNERSGEAEALVQELVASAAPGTAWAEFGPMTAASVAMRSHGPTAEGVAAVAAQVEVFDRRDPGGRAAIGGHVNLAFFLNRLGRHEEALHHHRIVEGLLEALPESPTITTLFRTRLNIAATLRGTDGLRASMEAFDAIDAAPLDGVEAARACLARLRVLHAAAADGDDGTRQHLAAALPRAMSVLGTKQQDVRGSVNVLAGLMLTDGDHAAAADLYRRHPAPLDLESSDEIDLSSAFNHAMSLMRIGRPAEAVPMLDAVVRRATVLLGEDAELTRMAVAHYVYAAVDCGETEAASRLLGGWMLALGTKDAWGVASQQRLFELNELMEGQGRPAIVPALLLPALKLAKKLNDEIALLYLSQWMAGLFGRGGKTEAAKLLAAEAAELAGEIGHEETRLACLLTVAEAHRELGELPEAIATFRIVDEQAGAFLADGHAIPALARQRLRELDS